MRESKKIFLPFAPKCIDEIASTIKGNSVYYTAVSDESSASFGEQIKNICLCVGSCITADMSFEAISDSVFRAADTLGGFDMVIYVPDLNIEEKVFLDIDVCDVVAHTQSLNALFFICKCALPYMLGSANAEIIVFLPRCSKNAVSDMYRCAATGIAEAMNKELAEYGVTVKVK